VNETLLAKRLSLALALLLPTACVGSWAQPTHVSIVSIAPSHVRGDAEVLQATTCAARCTPTGDSEIRVALSAAKPETNYELILAKGSCSELPRVVNLAVLSRGGALLADVVRANVAIPVHPLTAGGYILFVRKERKARPLACGQIRSSSIY